MQQFFPHYRKNLWLAYPIILSQAGQMLTGIADNVMVGQVGTAPLAASAFANGVFNNVMIFGMGFSVGLTPLIGAAFGKRDTQTASGYLQNGLFTNLLVGLLLFVVLIAAMPLLPYFGQPEEVLQLATPYFTILLFSMIPMMLFFSFKQFTEAVNVTKPAMVFTLTGNLLNIFLNYILIFGKFGFPAMGLIGAGYATLIARVFMGVGLFWYVYRNRRFQAFTDKKLFSKGGWQLGKMKKVATLGLPIGLQFLLEGGAFSMGTIMMGWLGSIELAAHQIALSLASLTFMTVSGMATATTVRVSNLSGSGAFRDMRLAAHASYHLIFGFMLICATGFLVGRFFFPSLFIDSEAVIGVAASLLLWASVFQVFDGLQVGAMSALRGLGDVKTPTIIAFVAYWVISLPLGYWLSFHTALQAQGIWIGFCAGLGTACILLMFRFEVFSKRMLKGEKLISKEGKLVESS